MDITILQTDIAWCDREGNLRRLDAELDAVGDTDLIVLPEMFATGFVTQPDGVAEADASDSPCPTLQWMRRVAARKGCAVAGSIAVAASEKRADGAAATPTFRNRFYFVAPDGAATAYDKHHLFTYSGEHRRFAAGTERVMVSYRGVRIALFVCYDLRFPVWSRNGGDASTYDVALYVASWPVPRIDAWDALLRARAIENQCYVVGVNRVGSDPSCSYCGSSAVIDPHGCAIAECGRDRVCAATARISTSELAAFRRQFPVLADADAFQLKRERESREEEKRR